MASIKRRGKVWSYAVSNYVDGKSRPIRKSGFATKKEAEIAAAEVELSLKNNTYNPQLNTVFYDYFLDWINLYKAKSISAATMKHYVYTANKIRDYFANTKITAINRTEYQHFLNHLGERRAKETVEKVHLHIRSCVNDAIANGIIALDFTRKATVSFTVPAKPKEEKFLNYEDYSKMLNYVAQNIHTTKVHCAIFVIMVTGVRFSELVGITTSDFDFTKGTLTINKTWNYKKGTEFGWGKVKGPASNRTIKINEKSLALIKEYIDRMPPNEYDLLFYSEESVHKCIANNTVNDLLKEISYKLRIDRITAHGLRHTHASILIYKKASIYYVSERLGHENINMTLKTYTHVLREMRSEDEMLFTHALDNAIDYAEM